jgi:hypothetical protein
MKYILPVPFIVFNHPPSQYEKRRDQPVVNASTHCEGLITRRRNREDKLEENALNFIVVCSKVLPYGKRMVIDKSKDVILTIYRTSGDAKDRHRFTEYFDLDIKVEAEKPERVEIFNFK